VGTAPGRRTRKKTAAAPEQRRKKTRRKKKRRTETLTRKARMTTIQTRGVGQGEPAEAGERGRRY